MVFNAVQSRQGTAATENLGTFRSDCAIYAQRDQPIAKMLNILKWPYFLSAVLICRGML